MDKICALTFDDGPSDVTPLFLDKLKKYGVKASFFVIGDNITTETESIVKRAFNEGHEIQNHSRTHADMTKLSAEEIKAEIAYTSEKITGITGTQPTFFRPPFICVNELMYESIDLAFICGLGSEDWVPEVTASQRAEKAIAQAQDGCIFLLHDMKGNLATLEALDTIIPALAEKGFCFVTISELFRQKGKTPQRHILYSFAQQTE